MQTPASQDIEYLTRRAADLSIEKDKVVDIERRDEFLQTFYQVILKILNQKLKCDIRSQWDVRNYLLSNPSLIALANSLAIEYEFYKSPKNLRDIAYQFFKSIVPDGDIVVKDFLQSSFLSAELSQRLIDQIIKENPLPNKVSELNDSLRIRRLDSLARLLTLGKKYSVCTAVSFVDHQILIAANNSLSGQNKSGDAICQLLLRRFLHIRSFILFVHNTYSLKDIYDPEAEKYQEAYTDCLNPFFQTLFSDLGGSQFADVTLYQAITKLIYSTMDALPEDLRLEKQDKDCLLSSEHIVTMTVTPRNELVDLQPELSKKEKSKIYLMMAENQHAQSRKPFQYFLLNCANQGALSKFHAEQLIAFYRLNIQSKTVFGHAIGVSKLCCPTCHSVLGGKGAIYRGTHYHGKHDTLDIFSLGVESKKPREQDASTQSIPLYSAAFSSSFASPSSVKKRPINFICSPFFSPEVKKHMVQQDIATCLKESL